MTAGGGRPRSVSAAVAQRIREARVARHMNRQDLVNACANNGHGHLTYAALSNIEGAASGAGRYRPITVDELAAVAEALGIPAVALLAPGSCLSCGGEPPAGFTCNTCGGVA